MLLSGLGRMRSLRPPPSPPAARSVALQRGPNVAPREQLDHRLGPRGSGGRGYPRAVAHSAAIMSFAAELQAKLKKAWEQAQGRVRHAGEQLATTSYEIAEILARNEEEDAPQSLLIRLKKTQSGQDRAGTMINRPDAMSVVQLPAKYKTVYR